MVGVGFCGWGEINGSALPNRLYKSEARNKKFETIPNAPNSNVQNFSCFGDIKEKLVRGIRVKRNRVLRVKVKR
jgi:hypothetical protein